MVRKSRGSTYLLREANRETAHAIGLLLRESARIVKGFHSLEPPTGVYRLDGLRDPSLDKSVPKERSSHRPEPNLVIYTFFYDRPHRTKLKKIRGLSRIIGV